ncbi:xanthine dehydrogenase family protein molybdopterin-binding subunit [Pseudorhodoplanes sp.]|uniref:xanthine dehydrogenase family protein molybdopterin-binding subunit n=1 Tax=Pseudorhodoplanes sp. TaxID=1934341 RepID=UPI002B6EC925|nr:xanthine dehydrogenase family protein molybdopterin-binding subunit [Pseudorhodoplanes sp.]HWV54087.1 xanthine dehydrogenase family protein molybdopterin-binding subunit [Pseudorhodoplanes sp.]
MNIREDISKSDDWAVAKFGVGQPVPRTEDPTLVQGKGHYTDDIALPGQAYAAIVRSPHAHGVLNGIDTSEAATMPGVLGIYTAQDLAAYGTFKCIVPFKNRDGTEMRKPQRFALASGKVRYVGDPVAFVVAETAVQARDAAEAVVLDIDPLPAVTLASDAAKPDAPQLFDDAPGNLALDYHYGDAEKVAAAFAQAAHVTKLSLRNTRLVVAAMEPRAAVAEYDPTTEHFTLHAQSQGVFGMKGQLVDIMGIKPDKMRVLTGNVGGSFGMKAQAYSEYICILHAARQLGRPVKWTDDRSGAFMSDSHGRDHEMIGELALDKDGHFLAVRLSGYANMGAFLAMVAPLPGTLNAVKNTPSVYRTPLLEVSAKCMFTNTTQVSAYRGAGRPEGNYYMERLIDAAAAEMGIDRLELRRRNHIAPSQIPYAAPSGMKYDSGDFPALFEEALAGADLSGFAARKKESEARGKLRGLGVGSFLEVTAPPGKEMGGIRFEENGDVTIITGTLDYGQGHAAPYAQVLSRALGIPFERIRLVQGDSDQLLAGGGTGGSRSITASGAAILEASAKVIENGKAIASHVLEAAPADIEFTNGRFVIAGTDRAIGIMELAEKRRAGLKLPDGTPSTLDASLVSDGVPSSFPNGCHVAEVEIDPETGVVEVVRYSSVNDFGTIVNPLLVQGQVHGGVIQGLGQALMENVSYDEDGQLLTGSFQDYAMPRAHSFPDIGFASHPAPATTNPLGTKGCGEAGCAGALVCVMNAIVDALSVYGIRHIDMPASPARVWAAIQAAKSTKAA